MRAYIKSVFSFRKISHPLLSYFAFWTDNSGFDKSSEIRAMAVINNSKIGKYTRINSNCKLVHTEVGNFSAIGKGAILGFGRHPLNYVSTHSIFYKKNKMRNDWMTPIEFETNLPIKIGNDVWVGRDAKIMDGVTVGDGAVVAAGSIVTKNVPPYAIVGGIPAKLIKKRFPEDVITRLLDLEWWNLPDEIITKNKAFFNEPELTIHTINKYFPD